MRFAIPGGRLPAAALCLLLLGDGTAKVWAGNCAEYNAQSRRSAEGLARELRIANGPLLASDLSAGRNPKLEAYLAQFAPGARVHGLQGRPEPADLLEVKAHYGHVMSSPSNPERNPAGGLQEDIQIVAGPMAAHRYHATLQVPGFPPDFAYYDASLPLELRGQTVFDFGGSNGRIRERWSNHDNRYRTGQLWRYMLDHPRDVDPSRFRTDLSLGSDRPGGVIDRDGERLNAVFNGELILRAGDFSLVDGNFRYGAAQAPEGASRPVTEAEGLGFVQHWFATTRLPVDEQTGAGWLADHATLHGAGCDSAAALDTPARVGGAGSGRLAALTLQRTLLERLGTEGRSSLLQPVSADTPYAEFPISAWSFVAFQTVLENPVAAMAAADSATHASIRYCAQWVMRLRAAAVTQAEPMAEEVWIDLSDYTDSPCMR